MPGIRDVVDEEPPCLQGGHQEVANCVVAGKICTERIDEVDYATAGEEDSSSKKGPSGLAPGEGGPSL